MRSASRIHWVSYAVRVQITSVVSNPFQKRRLLYRVSGGELLCGEPVSVPRLPRRDKVERETRQRKGEHHAIYRSRFTLGCRCLQTPGSDTNRPCFSTYHGVRGTSSSSSTRLATFIRPEVPLPHSEFFLFSKKGRGGGYTRASLWPHTIRSCVVVDLGDPLLMP